MGVVGSIGVPVPLIVINLSPPPPTGEHCLDPDTHLLDLYNSNSSGEWVIKLRANGGKGAL